MELDHSELTPEQVSWVKRRLAERGAGLAVTEPEAAKFRAAFAPSPDSHYIIYYPNGWDPACSSPEIAETICLLDVVDVGR